AHAGADGELAVHGGSDQQPFPRSAEELAHALLVAVLDEHDHFEGLVEREQPLDEVVDEDADALIGKDGEAVVAPQADAKGPIRARARAMSASVRGGSRRAASSASHRAAASPTEKKCGW